MKEKTRDSMMIKLLVFLALRGFDMPISMPTKLKIDCC